MTMTPIEERAGEPDLRRAFSGAWSQAPLLLLASGVVSVATAVGVGLMHASVLIGLLACAALVPPGMVGLVRCTDRIMDGHESSLREYAQAVRQLGARAIGMALVPTVLALLTFVAATVERSGGGVFFLVPMGLGITSTVLTTAALLVAFPLRTRHDQPGGTALWLLSLHVLARTPVPFLAAACVAGLGVWAAASFSNGLFVLVPAPLSIMLTAAYRVSTAERILSGA